MLDETKDISSGNGELDEILGGGFTTERLYLIEGHPGTGKTTLGLHFLLEGVRLGERTLYVTLSESRQELIAAAASHGWSLEGIEIYELLDPGNSTDPDAHYTMFDPAEIEMAETSRELLGKIEDIQPHRLVLDSLSEMRMLAQSPLRFRRQILALKKFLCARGITALLLDDKTVRDQDLQLQSIAHGVIEFHRMASNVGFERRRMRVLKYRGKAFYSGWHDYAIERGGLHLYPRLSPAIEDRMPSVFPEETLNSGNQSLDALLGGGVQPGTSTLLLGPAGVGKSSCAIMYAVTAAKRGDRAVIFAFDENKRTIRLRSSGLGMDLEPLEADGSLTIHRFVAGEVAPGEFAHQVRRAVSDDAKGRRTSMVVIDSLNGYMSSMPEEPYLQTQMHELLDFLSDRGIVTFLVVAQHGMVGSNMRTPVDASYLADNVLLFRYFEAAGEIRQAISVVKKRSGGHERSIREFSMRDGEISVGEPLRNFHAVLSGSPVFCGDSNQLMGDSKRHGQP